MVLGDYAYCSAGLPALTKDQISRDSVNALVA